MDKVLVYALLSKPSIKAVCSSSFHCDFQTRRHDKKLRIGVARESPDTETKISVLHSCRQ